MKDDNLTKLFSALGDPTRYKMVRLIDEKPSICVSELASEVGITPAGASQHLDVLEKAGLLRPYRDGKKVCYEIEKDPAYTALIKLMKEGDK